MHSKEFFQIDFITIIDYVEIGRFHNYKTIIDYFEIERFHNYKKKEIFKGGGRRMPSLTYEESCGRYDIIYR